MHTHVPECIVPWISECICDALRMCEERVRAENHCSIAYNHALDKARHAIAFEIVHSIAGIDREYIQRAEVLAIIDSLREATVIHNALSSISTKEGEQVTVINDGD